MQFRTRLKKRLLLSALVTLVASVNVAQARSGRAAYHYYSSDMITCSRYEPIGSVLRVTNPENGHAVTVRVTGSGPYNGNRILDMSTGAFSQLYGGTGRGVGPVSYEVISRGGGGGVRLASRGGYKRGWTKKRNTRRARGHYRHHRRHR